MKIFFLFFSPQPSRGHFESLIHVYARPFCRRQEVYSPPAHLQQYERKDEKCEQSVCIAIGRAKMKIEQIAEPRGECPCLLGIPCPIVTPCLFCPQGTHCHSQRKEHPAYAHKAITDCIFFVGDFSGSFPHPQIDCEDGCSSHHGV